MTAPLPIHEGRGWISYRILLVGAGFSDDVKLKEYAYQAIANLWKIEPFGIAVGNIDVWAVDGGGSVITGLNGRVSHLDLDAFGAAVDALHETTPSFPNWASWWSDANAMRAGIIVVDLGADGYVGLLPSENATSPPLPPTESLCRLEPSASYSIVDKSLPGAYHVIVPAFPLGGTEVVDARYLHRYEAVSAQIAKSVGLLLGLGDELESVADTIFTGLPSDLPPNLVRADLYDNTAPNVESLTSTSVRTDFYSYWKHRWGRLRGAVTSLASYSATDELPEGKHLFLVHASWQLIEPSPMMPESPLLSGITVGTHLIEGGGGFRQGVYRTRPNCILRLPWRYSATTKSFVAAQFCPACEVHLRGILSGYVNYSLGQTVLEPTDFDPEEGHDTGAELAAFICREGADAFELPSFAQGNSLGATLARISHFFGTELQIKGGVARPYRVNGDFFEKVVAADVIPDIRLPILRYLDDDALADAFWVKDYWDPTVFESYPEDLQDAACLNIATGVAGAMMHFGLGYLVNSSASPDRYRKTLSDEEITRLRPGCVLEWWVNEQTARDSVKLGNAARTEAENRTLILLERSQGRLRFCDHQSRSVETDESLSELKQTDTFIIAANWFPHGKGRQVLTSYDVRSAADNAAAAKIREIVFERLNDVVYEPPINAELHYGVEDFKTTEAYLADLDVLRGAITGAALRELDVMLTLLPKVSARLREAYVDAGSDAEGLLDELLWSLNCLLAFVENPELGIDEGPVGMRPFWEHLHGVAPPMSEEYPQPPPYEESIVPIPTSGSFLRKRTTRAQREYLESVLFNGMAASSNSLEVRVWTLLCARHPILSAWSTHEVNPSYGQDVALILAALAADPSETGTESRYEKLREFVRRRIENLETGRQAIRDAYDAQTEKSWYLLLPTLYRAAGMEIDRQRFAALHQHAIENLIKRDLAPDARTDEIWTAVSDFSCFAGLAMLVIAPVLAAGAGGATTSVAVAGEAVGAGGAATAEAAGFATAVLNVLEAKNLILIAEVLDSAAAIAGATFEVYKTLEYADESEAIGRLEAAAPLLFGENRREVASDVTGGVLSKLIPIFVVLGAFGLGRLARRSQTLRLRRALYIAEEGLPSEVVAVRIQELLEEGHGVPRHVRVTSVQTEARVYSGIDPMTGTTVDGVSGGVHTQVRTATRFLTEEASVRADNYIRLTENFDLGDWKHTNWGHPDSAMFSVTVPLDEIGPEFRNLVDGSIRLGSKSNPTGVTQAVFGPGSTITAVFKKTESGAWGTYTIFPNPPKPISPNPLPIIF